MASSAPRVWIDGIPGVSPVLCFENPLRVIRAENPGEVPAALIALDAAVADGCYVAGYCRYEAFAPAARANEKSSSLNQARSGNDPVAGPVLWFGVFEAPGGSFESELDPGTGYSLLPRKEDRPKEARARFMDAVERIRSEIGAGNVYQVNYTQSWNYHFTGDPLALYNRMRRLQPAAYRAFVRHDDHALLSCSPELFVRLQDDMDGAVLETRPIKGTVPRGRDPEMDRRAVAALRNDPKNRAENAMIVDLLRNDLGVHARPGSVRTPELFAVETLPTLHQMYSVIQARIDPARRAAFFQTIWPALFPCGSITGAPKRAARLMIRALESEPRGVYTGSIGWCGPALAGKRGDDANVHGSFSVAIRTLEVDTRAGRARFGSGCGIVWDSRPAAEWREARLKGSFLVPALDDFRVFTTLRYEHGRVYFVRDHLRRLRRAARHYGLPWSTRALRDAWREAVSVGAGAWRVRIALDREGRFEIRTAALEVAFARGMRRVRIALSPERVDSGSPFRARKTSEREIYDREWARAREQGLEEMFFLNERGEVVETCTGNLIILTRDGRWITPGPGAGALPGIYLGRLMRATGRISVEACTLEDLREARVVLICNAVRGMRRAIIARS